MNIYVLHHSPILCAHYYDNITLSKAVIETAGILAAAHRIIDGRKARIKGTNERNTFVYAFTLPEEVNKAPIIPLAYGFPDDEWIRWAMDSEENYTWLAALYRACCREFIVRNGYSHGYARFLPLLQELPSFFITTDGSEFPIKVPDDCEVLNDAVASYRKFYLASVKCPQWKKRGRPIWMDQPSDRESFQVTTTESGPKSGSDQLMLF